MATKQQPKWHKPVTVNPPPTIKIYNSLTKSKIDFIPIKGKQITWYSCGPTVYDASHVGHARNYVTIDYLRRILSDYFNYDVLFVMNVTDIDDKIILRARQNHLFNQLKSDTNALTRDLIDKVQVALKNHARTKLGVADGSLGGAMAASAASEGDPKYLMYANAFVALVIIWVIQRDSVGAIVDAQVALEDNDISREMAHKLLDSTQFILSSWLDEEKGSAISDPKIFRELAAYWEQDFMEDMTALNVRPCDILTRVSEYVPEIVEYVQKIVDNGYAYEVEGSVYFDTVAFDGHKNHHYAKLEPWSAGNTGLINEGEGTLGSKLTGKKTNSDFALWKKSKPGEPAWDSPWGPAGILNALEILGENMDIHSGGIDLAFPHHDNELAQSEAYHGCPQWVNYFVHAGHLEVEGQKMSKSLKNFITIKEALKKYTPRQLRLCFLLHQWNSKFDFKDSSMNEAKNIETILNNFFVNAKALINENKLTEFKSDGIHRFKDSEQKIIKLLQEKQEAVHNALCDSINTPTALAEIMDLVSKTNIYLSAKRGYTNVNVIEKIAKYVTKILRVFGLCENTADEAIGFGVSEQQAVANTEDIVMPYLRVLSSFRDNVRELARQERAHLEFLTLSDKLRDIDLVELGVSLDDREDGKALVKLVDKEELIKAREAKAQAQLEKVARKEALAKAKEEEKKAKLEKGKIPAEEMFKLARGENDEIIYSLFDEQGIPTHDAQGQELAKSRVKKIKKEWETQQKLHSEYLEWVKQQESGEGGSLTN
ncbi:8116_t:CDS:10 [Ambispora gerdemannii]|uniref:cysteine--tRNA ligase n=1 Tax=Ambispora gerdemannii TaxID=144530 RepID=A0A9N8UWD4_9GLOM|nr:8116_t:CDS:10 [Ambispora gerdemannii]